MKPIIDGQACASWRRRGESKGVVEIAARRQENPRASRHSLETRGACKSIVRRTDKLFRNGNHDGTEESGALEGRLGRPVINGTPCLAFRFR